jgi:hypothetical protein
MRIAVAEVRPRPPQRTVACEDDQLIRTHVQAHPLLLLGLADAMARSAQNKGKREEGEVLKLNVRYAVFSIRRLKNGSVWVRAGSAWVNKDGSMNLYLDVLPLDGTLHVREPGERRDFVPDPRTDPTLEATEEHTAEGSH